MDKADKADKKIWSIVVEIENHKHTTHSGTERIKALILAEKEKIIKELEDMLKENGEEWVGEPLSVYLKLLKEGE